MKLIQTLDGHYPESQFDFRRLGLDLQLLQREWDRLFEAHPYYEIKGLTLYGFTNTWNFFAREICKNDRIQSIQALIDIQIEKHAALMRVFEKVYDKIDFLGGP